MFGNMVLQRTGQSRAVQRSLAEQTTHLQKGGTGELVISFAVDFVFPIIV